MDKDALRHWLHKASDWSADYLESVSERPVRAQGEPGSIYAALPEAPPAEGEPMEAIFKDLDALIMPGMTHWQHPRFFAYFPANSSPPSLVAEYVTAAMAAQCMLWQTAPAASELEARVLEWLRQMIGLPQDFAGVIQDSATSATFAAILTAREKVTGFTGNTKGLCGQAPLRIYASAQTHTSIDKAVRMAGIGSDNLVKVPNGSGPYYAMDTEALEALIEADKEAGLQPAAIVACLGGTSIGACDDIEAVAAVAARHGIFLHVDAAWAGSAMICPEFRDLMRGAELADSFVFNPHKWLFTNFDCTAHYVKDPRALTDTLGMRPPFLRTLGREEGETPGVTDYNEWSVPLGRRFRALKLWFVIRSYGVEALRTKIRNHVAWAQGLAKTIGAAADFEVVTEPILALFTFRYRPRFLKDASDETIDALNARLVERINDDGRIYVTQTTHEGRFAIRFQVGQTSTTARDVEIAWEVIRELAGASKGGIGAS
ncbi:pyridoxal-dependent decarboxylase [Breoghania sp. L-A4]|uniref:pyridoxal phosphate-dependent decarboxylase family protein n=1 Tax=Breoghania sp. L-A4 TaxID=2304600 RepID=UPI000E3588C7|nr:pyridoxal-dependent decarboxylase [Breoghania sp. L-A4]AXS40385.1 aspartate aminotransferase family protein [Breoghania sp. L-A4]